MVAFRLNDASYEYETLRDTQNQSYVLDTDLRQQLLSLQDIPRIIIG